MSYLSLPLAADELGFRQCKRGLMVNKKLLKECLSLSVWVYEMRSGFCAAPYLWVVAPGVVQQSQTDVVQPLDFTGVVVEALKRPTADIPWTHQAALNLHWEGETENREKEISVNFPMTWNHSTEWASQIQYVLLCWGLSKHHSNIAHEDDEQCINLTGKKLRRTGSDF